MSLDELAEALGLHPETVRKYAAAIEILDPYGFTFATEATSLAAYAKRMDNHVQRLTRESPQEMIRNEMEALC